MEAECIFPKNKFISGILEPVAHIIVITIFELRIKKADLIIIDLMTPEWVPWHKYNLIENLILSATGASVDTNIIDGKIVMEGREIKTFNEKKVMDDMQADIGELLETLDFLGTEKPYPEMMPPLW